MVARSPAPLPCSAHCHHGTVPTYTRTAATFTSDGLGPTVDAPCLRCGGTGNEPCEMLCGRSALVEDHGFWCAECHAEWSEIETACAQHVASEGVR